MQLTVFTPTYNRGYILPQLYTSLNKQNCLDFIWLIIDDGSTDNTELIVKDFKNTAKFEIIYVKKENGGKHTAINLMTEIVTSRYVFIVDSDDYLTEDAIKTILDDITLLKYNKDSCGIIYLRSDFDGNIIGNKFPLDNEFIWPNHFYYNLKIRGDKCEVFDIDKLKLYKFPEYQGENFIGEGAVYTLLYSKYKALARNKIIYKCEYIEDGLSKAGRKLRIKNPLGGIYNAKIHIRSEFKLSIKIKYMLLYICYGFFANIKPNELYNSINNKMLYLILLPLGYLLYLFWKFKYK